MFKKIKGIFYHPLFFGSLLMVLGTNLANFFAYLYHLIFGRLLGPAGYGEFAAIIAVISIVNSIFLFFSTSIVKFASSKDKVRDPQIDSFVSWANKVVLIILAVFTMASPLLARHLGISTTVAFLIGPNVYLLYLLMIYSAILQSDLKFKEIVIANGGGWLIRLLVSILIFYLGFRLFGIFMGYFIASLFSLAVLLHFVKLKPTGSISKSFLRTFFRYSIPVIVMFFAMNSFITTDVILVKKFFSSYDTGLYSALSALGKIVFYGTLPVTSVIFPLVAKKSFDKKSTKKIFYVGFLTVLMISSVVLLTYFLFPSIVINIMFGSQYLEVWKILGVFGVSSLLFSSNYVFVNYYLSKGITLPTLFVLLGAVLQIFGIIIYHTSLSLVIGVSIFSSLVCLILMILYSLWRLDRIRRMASSEI